MRRTSALHARVRVPARAPADRGVVLVRPDQPVLEVLGELEAAASELAARRRFSDVPGVWRRALEILLGAGALTRGQIDAVLEDYRGTGSLASALTRTGVVTERELAEALTRARAARLVSLQPSPVDPVDPRAARRLPLEVARSLDLVIISATGRHGVVAMADPHDERALFEAERRARLRLFRVAADRADVHGALTRAWTVGGPARQDTAAAPRRAAWRRPLLGLLTVTALGALALVFRDAIARYAFSAVALVCGAFFFLYALKYYVAIASVLVLALVGDPRRARGSAERGSDGPRRARGYRTLRGEALDAVGAVVVASDPWPTAGDERRPAGEQPFVSVHLALYNESRVVDRLMAACTSFDHERYEVIVVDDSTDETTALLERWKDDPRVRVIHRPSRSGFKGGALREALRRMDPQTEYVMVFDADFVPPADAIRHFLDYFGRAGEASDRLAAVQGYQWHMLNASENWITKGIRAEFSGSYVLERAAQELFGTMKMISGSVYMIRADVLRRLAWSTSITEDWELTIRLYLAGHKVLYTPYIQAPAECVSTVHRLIRQRMRWARGHTHNVRKHFFAVLRSPNMTWREKLEFLYYAPYYLQSVLFTFGTFTWLLGTFVLGQKLPMWSEVLGWSLVLSNALALPLMNLAGILLEGSVKRDAAGVLSFIGLSWLLVPFQALASLQGLIEPREGGWARTPKSGRVTESLRVFRLARLLPWELPRRPGTPRLVGIVITCLAALLAGSIVAIGALSMRAAASTGTVAEGDLILPFILGTLLPLAILAYGWFRLHRRIAVCVLAAAVGLSANVVFLAATIPASATAGTSGTFYLRSSVTLGCADLDMIQSAPTSATASTLPGWKSATKTFCSDTFTATMSIATGTVVVTTYWTNSNAAACSMAFALLRDATSLATATTSITKKTTPTPFTTSLAITGFTFADGERLGLRLTGANTNGCRDSTLFYDGTLESSGLVTTTIVPEGLLGLLLLAPLVPVAIRRRLQ